MEQGSKRSPLQTIRTLEKACVRVQGGRLNKRETKTPKQKRKDMKQQEFVSGEAIISSKEESIIQITETERHLVGESAHTHAHTKHMVRVGIGS